MNDADRAAVLALNDAISAFCEQHKTTPINATGYLLEIIALRFAVHNCEARLGPNKHDDDDVDTAAKLAARELSLAVHRITADVGGRPSEEEK